MSEQAATPATPAPNAAPAPVAVADSPTGAAIPTATPAKPESIIPPVQQQSRVVSARKALGLPESPSKVVQSMAKDLKSRVDQTAIKLSPKVIKPETPTEEAAPAPEKPAEPVAPAAQVPSTPAPAPEPKPEPVPAKITVNGKEYTQEELEKALAAKEEPKTPDPKPTEPKPTEQKPQTPAQPEISEAEQEKAYLQEAKNRYKFTPEQLDTILSGGEEAVELFTNALAKTELNARKWAQEQINPVLEQLHGMISPISQQYQQVQQYQAEANFKSANPELADRMDLVRTVAQSLQQRYPNEVAKMDEKQFFTEVANHAKSVLKRMGVELKAPEQQAATPAPVATPTPTPAPAPAPAPQPTPPAPRLGGTPAPQKPNFQRAAALDVMNH